MRPPYSNRIAVAIAALTVIAAGEARAQAIPDPSDPLGQTDPLGDYDLMVDIDQPLRGTIGEEIEIGDINTLEIGEEDEDADGEIVPGPERRARQAELDPRAAPPDARDPVVREDSGLVSPFVRERAREELEPLGLRAGSFVIFPEVESAVEVTDNVFAAPSGRESDVLFVARPAVRVQSDWGRHEVTLGYSGEYGAYADNSSEDPEQTTVTASGRLDVTRRTALAVDGNFAMEQEGRSDPDTATGSVEPTARLRYGVAGEASHRFNRLTAALRGGIEIEDYEDGADATGAVIDNSDRNRQVASAGGRLTYEVSPATTVFADGEYAHADYERALDDAGFARDSDRVTARLGTTLEPTPLTRVSASIGYVHEEFADARLEPLDEVIGDADIAWAVTPLTTLNASYAGTVDTTTQAGSSGSVSHTFAAGFDHELLRQLIISLGGSYQWVDYRGIALAEETVTASVSAEYRLNRAAALTAGYEHETRIPNDGSGNIAENVFKLGLTLRR